MLATTKEIFDECKKNDNLNAIGAFNTINLETSKAIIEAAIELNKPVILQVTEKTFRYSGSNEIAALIREMIDKRSKKIKVALHLDHGKTFAICKKAIKLGFTSVMIDGSKLSFEENKNLTKRVVDYAHPFKVTVQGELGTVPYIGKHLIDQYNGEEDKIWNEYMTNPKQAEKFAKETGIDTLAVAIGNAHGFQKERSVPDWERLKQIKERTKLPLILHGSSDWSENKIKKAISLGINCFNVDTELRTAFINKLCTIFENECRMQDPREIMKEIKDCVKEKVKKRIKLFNPNKS